MILRREPPPPTPTDPPSVTLLRAIGDLQAMEGGEAITDVAAITLLCGAVFDDVVNLGRRSSSRTGYIRHASRRKKTGRASAPRRWRIFSPVSRTRQGCAPTIETSAVARSPDIPRERKETCDVPIHVPSGRVIIPSHTGMLLHVPV